MPNGCLIQHLRVPMTEMIGGLTQFLGPEALADHVELTLGDQEARRCRNGNLTLMMRMRMRIES